MAATHSVYPTEVSTLENGTFEAYSAEKNGFYNGQEMEKIPMSISPQNGLAEDFEGNFFYPEVQSTTPQSFYNSPSLKHLANHDQGWHGDEQFYAENEAKNIEYQSCKRESTGVINQSAMRKTALKESTGMLKDWLHRNSRNPYPTKSEKIMLAILTKMTLTQVSTWFANARRRLKKENKMTWLPKTRCNEIKIDQKCKLNENDYGGIEGKKFHNPGSIVLEMTEPEYSNPSSGRLLQYPLPGIGEVSGSFEKRPIFTSSHELLGPPTSIAQLPKNQFSPLSRNHSTPGGEQGGGMSPVGDYVQWWPTDSFDVHFASQSRHFSLSHQLPPEKSSDLTKLSHAPDASRCYVTNNESSDWPLQNLINQSNTHQGMPHQPQNMENNFMSNASAYRCHEAIPSGESLKPLNSSFSSVPNTPPTQITSLSSSLSELPYSQFLPQNPGYFPTPIRAKESKEILPCKGQNTLPLLCKENSTEHLRDSFGSKACDLASYKSGFDEKPISTESFDLTQNSKELNQNSEANFQTSEHILLLPPSQLSVH